MAVAFDYPLGPAVAACVRALDVDRKKRFLHARQRNGSLLNSVMHQSMSPGCGEFRTSPLQHFGQRYL
jgi:hypothetical protein